ncbi:hypothetical protein FHL15_010596 [Xylaria flabelliformis]|uniref:F-box domain-containing protein n=1 Tax=Xylaria flabelliformis TaxID=2512241 RepID=A0A553HKL0_9PEZI|nr:hypothetical protein FHL15_010596 [Xylaria flabelliformis]
MASSLEILPFELIVMIVKLLDFEDVLSLRCTSRAIESKASYEFFAKYFYRKNIKLETKTLERLAELSNNGRLTSRLQHCTIIGLAGIEAVEHEMKEQIRLLAAIFCNFAKNIQTGSIVSLSLRVVLRITTPGIYNWEGFWVTARQTFGIAMMALNSSNLSVTGNLDLFSSVPFCSLEYTSFPLLGKTPSLANNFKHLKRLTVRLSSPTEEIMPREYGFTDEQLRQREHVASTLEEISHLPAIMPELESLNLHWFHVTPLLNEQAQLPARRDTSSFSPALTLKECTLRGISLSESDLLQFIASTSPTTLRLENVDLVTGTYDSTFQHLTHANSQTTYCDFENLYCQRNHIVRFDTPQRPEEASEGLTNLGSPIFSQQLKKLGHEGIPHQLRLTFDRHTRDHDRLENYQFPEYKMPLSHEIAFSLENDQPIDAELSDCWIDGRPGKLSDICSRHLVVTYTTRSSEDESIASDEWCIYVTQI